MGEFQRVLHTAFEKNGISQLLCDGVSDKLEELCRIMQAKNEEMNITAITDDEGIATKHFCDSALLAPLLPNEGRMADIGCGGGFPCLPIALLKPSIDIVAVDSTAKKVSYVADTARALGLRNLKGVCMRAEEGAQGEWRESFDLACARAVAALPVLCELCIPYLKVGGIFFAMKGKGAPEELDASYAAVKALGAEVVRVHEFSLVCEDGVRSRYIIEIRKVSRTPAQYPRAYAKIKKKPL